MIARPIGVWLFVCGLGPSVFGASPLRAQDAGVSTPGLRDQGDGGPQSQTVDDRTKQQERELVELRDKLRSAELDRKSELQEVRKTFLDARWDVLEFVVAWTSALIGVIGAAATAAYFSLQKALKARLTRDVLQSAEAYVTRETRLAQVGILLSVAESHWMTFKSKGLALRVAANEFCLTAAKSAVRTIRQVFTETPPRTPREILQAINAKSQCAYYSAEHNFLRAKPITAEEKRRLIADAEWSYEQAESLRAKGHLPGNVFSPGRFVHGCRETHAWCLWNFGGEEDRAQAQAIVRELLALADVLSDEERNEFRERYELGGKEAGTESAAGTDAT